MTNLASIQKYNAICWRMSTVIYSMLLVKCGYPPRDSTETTMFYETVWGIADAVLFIKGRPHFHTVDGKRAPFNSGAPICLIAYGPENVLALERSGLGRVVAA